MNARQPSDLQLESDASVRFLPWALAVMVFLAALALAGALALDGTVAAWRQGVSSRLTVQLADRPGGPPMQQRLEAALAQLRAVPGVQRAEALERSAVEALLKPWLGDAGLAGASGGLPLPGVIDVELAPGQALSVAALAAQLEQTVPGARLDDPKPWLDQLVRLARLLQSLGLGIVLLVGMAMAALVIFATRAGLAARRGTIEVLHLIGAEDAYVARQFQRHVSRLAFYGGSGGWLAAVLILLAIQWLASNVGQGLLPGFALFWWHWLLLLLLPLAGLILAVLTARLTVLGELKRML
ncbi:cell division protein [Ferrovibrio sp.]|uniref:cell division protein FtsX n=1 Tax=Ferrovibrio sp. TaxID=1917215 RepID=UPI001B5C5002|nr:cell division protein [Ferrovibrio sp.]MBP7065000.1 cell division protein [Ferrovibrio sp.]